MAAKYHQITLKDTFLNCQDMFQDDTPLFSRFKTTFESYIELMFQKMVDLTEPIYQLIDSSLANIPTFDTSGIKLYVTENNPKTLNSLFKKRKAYYKDNPDVDPYRMAYGLMPSQAVSCPDAKQQYINRHFCYADKFAILTNGLGIIRHIAFLDDVFKEVHPEMPVDKKSDSPDEGKSVGDSCALHPVLSGYFALHPQFSPDTFLGASAVDTIETYGFLKDEFHFLKALIPYNVRNESLLPAVGYNICESPTCPNDSSLAMKHLVHCHEKGRAITHLKGNMCIVGRKSRHHVATKADAFLAGIANQFTVIVTHRMSYPQYIRSLKPLVA